MEDGYPLEEPITFLTTGPVGIGPGSWVPPCAMTQSCKVADFGPASKNATCASSLPIGWQFQGNNQASMVTNISSVEFTPPGSSTAIAFLYFTPEGIWFQPLLNFSVTGGAPFIQVGAAQVIPSAVLLPGTAGKTAANVGSLVSGMGSWASQFVPAATLASSFFPSPYNQLYGGTIQNTQVGVWSCFSAPLASS